MQALLLDLVLPGKSGLEILDEVRATRPTQPVIILTARGEENDRVEGLRDDVSFRFLDRGEGANWYYLRVEQIDGHLAWSSPWWVGGERPR